MLHVTVPMRNGHWYSVPFASADFESALAASPGYSYNNATGYLATITSAPENAFLAQVFPRTSVWIAGYEQGRDGNWTWASGPEINPPISFYAWAPSANLSNTALEGVVFYKGEWFPSPTSALFTYLVEYCILNRQNQCIRTLT